MSTENNQKQKSRQERSPSVEVTSGNWSKRRRNAEALNSTNVQKVNVDNVEIEDAEYAIDLELEKRDKNFPKTWDEIKTTYKIVRIVDKISGKVLTNDTQVLRKPTTLTKIIPNGPDKFMVVNYAEYYWKMHGQILHRDTMLIRCDGEVIPIENIIGVCKKYV